MRAPITALVLSVALVAPAAATDTAAPAITGPPDAAYGVTLKLKGASGGATVKWSVAPHPAGTFFNPLPGGHAVDIAGPPGTYVASATVTTAKIGALSKPLKDFAAGETVPLELTEVVATHTFTLTGTPGPGPGPGPPPPPPLDPLVTALRAAADADGMPRAQLATLGDAVTAAGVAWKAGQTAQAVHDAAKARLAGAPALGPAVLAIAREQTSRVLNGLLSDPGHELTAAEAQAGKDLFAKFATSLYSAGRQP